MKPGGVAGAWASVSLGGGEGVGLFVTSWGLAVPCGSFWAFAGCIVQLTRAFSPQHCTVGWGGVGEERGGSL